MTAKDQGPTSSDVERMRDALDAARRLVVEWERWHSPDEPVSSGVFASRYLLSLAARSEHQSAGRDSALEEAASDLWRLSRQYDDEGWQDKARHYRFAANRIRALKQEGGG